MLKRCWEDLAQAIILQAVEDYRKARRRLRIRPDSEAAMECIRECERFFGSRWFAQLTTLDGKALLRRLREEDVG